MRLLLSNKEKVMVLLDRAIKQTEALHTSHDEGTDIQKLKRVLLQAMNLLTKLNEEKHA